MIDKSALTAKRDNPTKDVDLPGVGTVRVRGLTRAEALRIQGRPMDVDEQERKLLALAMVDPAMTEDDVRAWQKVAPAAELEPIGQAIRELSGMGNTVVKDGIQQFRE